MKKIFCLLGIFVFSTHLFGQADTTKIAFIAYWSIGDSYDFKISKEAKTWEHGELTEENYEEYIANFTVIDSTENSYTISWSYEVNLINTYELPQEFTDIVSKYDLTEVIYKTTEYGEFVEILNWKEISQMISEMFDELNKAFEDEKLPEEFYEFMRSFKDIYKSQQGIEEILLQEILFIHFPLGYEFDPNQVLNYKDYLPNFFAEEPMEADAKIYFKNVDRTHGSCVMKHELSINPDATKQMLRQLFAKLNFDNEEYEEHLKSSRIEINDNNLFEYYYYPGIPHKIERTREIVVELDEENMRKDEVLIMELIYF